MKRLVGLLGSLLAFMFPAEAHDMKAMGRMEGTNAGYSWLYGMDRTDANLNVVNCCKHGDGGDCIFYPVEGVKLVDGGYLLQDGEFIPEREATVSPDENYYRCQHAGKVSHCFFAPARGF
jgi:hypothetical protein